MTNYCNPNKPVRLDGSFFCKKMADYYSHKITTVICQNIPIYNPDTKCVELPSEFYFGTDITLIAAALHEVGHSIDHARWPWLFAWRTRFKSNVIGYAINLFLEWHASKLAYRFLERAVFTQYDFPYCLDIIKFIYRKSFNSYL